MQHKLTRVFKLNALLSTVLDFWSDANQSVRLLLIVCLSVCLQMNSSNECQTRRIVKGRNESLSSSSSLSLKKKKRENCLVTAQIVGPQRKEKDEMQRKQFYRHSFLWPFRGQRATHTDLLFFVSLSVRPPSFNLLLEIFSHLVVLPFRCRSRSF